MRAWLLANGFLLGLVLIGAALLAAAAWLSTLLDARGDWAVWAIVALQALALWGTYRAGRWLHAKIEKRMR